jgi:hypothetical protein
LSCQAERGARLETSPRRTPTDRQSFERHSLRAPVKDRSQLSFPQRRVRYSEYESLAKTLERGYRREELTRFARIPSHKATLFCLVQRSHHIVSLAREDIRCHQRAEGSPILQLIAMKSILMPGPCQLP